MFVVICNQRIIYTSKHVDEAIVFSDGSPAGSLIGEVLEPGEFRAKHVETENQQENDTQLVRVAR